MKTLYQTLELDLNATPEDIKRKYHELALKYHPDKCKGSLEEKDEMAEKFKEINEANEILSCPEKRREYDLKLSSSYARTTNSLHKATATTNSAPSAKATEPSIEHLYTEKCKHFTEETRQVFDNLINKSPLWMIFVIFLPEDAIDYVNNVYFIRSFSMMAKKRFSNVDDVVYYLGEFNEMRQNIRLKAWEYLASLDCSFSYMGSLISVDNFINVPLYVLKEMDRPEFNEICNLDIRRASFNRDLKNRLLELSRLSSETIPFIFSPAAKMAIKTNLFSFERLVSMPEIILRTMDENYVKTGLIFIKHFEFNKYNKYASISPISAYTVYDRNNFVLSYILQSAYNVCWSHAYKLIQTDWPDCKQFLNGSGVFAPAGQVGMSFDAFIENILLRCIPLTPPIITQLKEQLEQEHRQLWASVDPLYAAKKYVTNVRSIHAALETESDHPALKLITLLLDQFEQILNEVELQMLDEEQMNTAMRL